MDVLGLGRSGQQQPQPPRSWVSLSSLEARRLRELTLFSRRFSRDGVGTIAAAETVFAAVTGIDDGTDGEEYGLVLNDEVLFDLQTLVAGLPDVDAVVVELHLGIYSALLDDLRALRGFVPLQLFPYA